MCREGLCIFGIGKLLLGKGPFKSPILQYTSQAIQVVQSKFESLLE